jgi:hypothetical protein
MLREQDTLMRLSEMLSQRVASIARPAALWLRAVNATEEVLTDMAFGLLSSAALSPTFGKRTELRRERVFLKPTWRGCCGGRCIYRS